MYSKINESESSHKKSIFKSYVGKSAFLIFANIVSLLINALTVLIVPKVLNTEIFGHYQLYLFYIEYAGAMYFGLCEGIYLREGGKYYKDIDKSVYKSLFLALALYEVVVCFLIYIIAMHFSQDYGKRLVIKFVCIAAVAICLKLFFTTLLQCTSRVKEYALVLVVDKVLFAVLIVILIAFGHLSLRTILLSNVFSLYISLTLSIWYCRNVAFSKTFAGLQKTIYEVKTNIAAGISIILSTLSSKLILGVVRFGIERRWDISTFGKVSLALSISNMAVTAINAIGVVIYPLLRRTNQDKLPEIYKIMRIMLMGLVFGALIFYYPAQKILTLWLPQYAESLRYAAILLPVCVYESKVSILINTYFNTLRLESLQMKCNLTALALSVVLTGVSIYVFDSVTVAILSILIVLVFRCVLCETVLSTKLPIKIFKDIILELVMTFAFIICNWYFGFIGMLIYAVCYVIYLIIKRKDILESLNFIKSMR